MTSADCFSNTHIPYTALAGLGTVMSDTLMIAQYGKRTMPVT